MSNVITFPPSRIVRIPPAHQPDCRLEFARMVERRAYEMEQQRIMNNAVSVLAGCYDLPSDTESR